jgi:hypothetical protein
MRIPTTTAFLDKWHGWLAKQEIQAWVRAGKPFEVSGHRFTVQIRNGRREVQDMKADTFFRAIFQFFTSRARAATRLQLQDIVAPLNRGPRLDSNGRGPIGAVIITGSESPAVTFRGRLLLCTNCKNAALANTDFHGAELRSVDFGNADLRKVQMTSLKAFQRCYFKGANLEGARITLDKSLLPSSCHTEEKQQTLRDLLRSIDTIDPTYESLRAGLFLQLTTFYKLPLEGVRAMSEPRRDRKLHFAVPQVAVYVDPELALAGFPVGRQISMMSSAPPAFSLPQVQYDPELALAGFPVGRHICMMPSAPPLPPAPPWDDSSGREGFPQPAWELSRPRA